MASYNHYTPQSDGSYRRSTIRDSGKRQTPRQPEPSSPCPPPPQQSQCQNTSHPEREPKPQPPCDDPHHETNIHNAPSGCGEADRPEGSTGILSFLRGLLPRQIDAADLLVIALLLLMEQDCEKKEGDLSPLLTIALYFLL